MAAADAADCCTQPAKASSAATYGVAVATIAAPPTPSQPVAAVVPAVVPIRAPSSISAAASASYAATAAAMLAPWSPAIN